MTRNREDEIAKASIAYANEEFPEHEFVWNCFASGAKWADKHPKEDLISIDKADKYLKEHIILYARAATLDQQKEWFNNFRKAMEG